MGGGCLGYTLDIMGGCRAIHPGFPGWAYPGFPGCPTLDFRGGILFFLPLLPLPSFPLPQHVAAVVSKLRAVPLEVVLRRQHPGVAVAAAGPFRFSQPPMRRLALAIDAEAARLGHNDEAVMLKLTEPAADAVGGAAHFLHSVQVRQEDAAVVLLLEAPPALEMHIEPARAVRCCAPRGRVHHFEVDGHEWREPALVLARAHDARSRDCCQMRLFATVMPTRFALN